MFCTIRNPTLPKEEELKGTQCLIERLQKIGKPGWQTPTSVHISREPTSNQFITLVQRN